MNHLNILKRSWQILWHYRALWLFGIILAIAASSTNGPGSSGSGYSFGREDIVNNIPSFTLQPGDWHSLQDALKGLSDAFGDAVPAVFGTSLAAVIIGLVCLGFILGIAFTILRYVANTTLMRMVDDYEETEERLSVGKGFRLGWSRASWRIFLIDLVINIPVAIAMILLFALSFTPLLLWLTKNNAAGILGTVAAIGFFFLAILIAILVGTIVSVLKQYIQRVCALQDKGVFESIRLGYRLGRQHLKDTALMWLILLGLKIAYSIGAAIVAFILLLPAVALAGGSGFLAGGFGNIFQHGALPWILAMIVGIPVFILIIGVPLLFLGGLKEVYLSSAWTLTYRELTALDTGEVSPEPHPQIEEPQLEKPQIVEPQPGEPKPEE